MYSVKHAAAMTGIPADTLRMWERRYHVVEPVRSDGGYRLYDDAAISRLSAMRALVAAGWSPRLAAEQVLSGTTTGAVADTLRGGALNPLADLEPLLPPSVDAIDDPSSLLPIAQDFDAGALQRVLAQMLGRDDFEHVVDHWLMPTLQALGNAWRAGVVTVAGEHFVSAAVQRRLATIFDSSPLNAGAPRVVVGLARHSRHELGVLAFAVALRRAGLDVVYVGSDLPAETWVVTAGSQAPAALVIGVPASDDIPAVRDTVAALAASRPDLPVFLGGGHQEAVDGTGEPLGHRIGVAAAEVARRLGVVRDPAAAP